MNTFLPRLIPAIAATISIATASEDVSYVNYIRQTQMPAGVTWDAQDNVVASGSKLSALPINPGGGRFDLWTVKSPGPISYLLDTSYVGNYIPISQVVIDSGDPYGKDLTNTGPTPKNLPAMIRRTRADKPFQVYINTLGLLSGATDPEPSKSVKLLRHVQSYGAGGTGVNLNRTQATLLSQASITVNGLKTLSYALTSIPGADRSKIRGEERFSVFSLEDYQAPESQLSSQFIQIWPVADGTITGIAQNEVIRFSAPTITLTLNDLYPDSRTYAQAYPGDPVLGTVGKILPGSNQIINDSTPQNQVLDLNKYDSVFDRNGRWTIELITVTPFGTERMRTPAGAPAVVSFDVDRTIRVNSSFTTIE